MIDIDLVKIVIIPVALVWGILWGGLAGIVMLFAPNLVSVVVGGAFATLMYAVIYITIRVIRND